MCSFFLPHFSGRSRGGRGGDYRDDRRDRYSGRRDFGGFRDRDNGRGFDNGPNKAFGTNTQNGGYGASSTSSGNGFSGGSYNGNGQSTFNAPAAAFGGQNFQAQQFAPPKGGAQTAAIPPFPFPLPPAPAPQQHPPPLVPYPMPPQFSQ